MSQGTFLALAKTCDPLVMICFVVNIMNYVVDGPAAEHFAYVIKSI